MTDTAPDSPGQQEAAPTPPGERIVAIDVIRGVAVLGILLVNIHIFRKIPLTDLMSGADVESRTSVDAFVEMATGTLVSSTFLGLFSLLFGFGLAIQLGRKRGARVGSQRALVCQRMFWLALIGFAHMQLVSTDILVAYALSGMSIAVLAGPRLPPPRIWLRILGATGLLLFVATVILVNVDAVHFTDFLYSYERSDTALQLLSDGALLARYEIRVFESFSYFGLYQIVTIVGWNLVGLWLGFSPVLKWLNGPSGPLLRVGGALLVAGIVLRLGMALPAGDPGILATPDGVAGATGVAGSTLLVLGVGIFVGGLSRWATERGHEPKRLASLGRMALTAYLLQSVLSMAILAIPGVRDWMDATNALVVTAGIWAFLLVACPWWMRRFRFGPVEWLWRCLTYLRMQPLRR